MAKVKITGHASGTGILTVTAPNTSTDRTITLPDATGTLLATEGAVVINESGADVDFRVEGDTDANALFVQGSDSKVGINTATPNAVLHIGDSSAEGSQANPALQIGRSAGSVGSYRLGFYTTSEGGHIENLNGDDGLNFKVKTSGQVLQLTTDGRGLSQFTAKCWVYFDGTGTAAIQDSHNVSSLDDSGAGDYRINFTNNLANVNYSITAMGNYAQGSSKAPIIHQRGGKLVASFELRCTEANTAYTNMDTGICATVFGD
jgi:hypothetical protein